jgi:hypothetical protein
MNKIQEIPWPRILAEGTAIVVSILLAFLKVTPGKNKRFLQHLPRTSLRRMNYSP